MSGLIEIFKLISEKNKKAVLNIVGNYKKDYAKKLLKKYQVKEDRVLFHGESKNVIEYYKKAGIFLHASFEEGQPMVFLEAKALGIPIVAAKFDGIDEILTHEEDSYVYEQSDYKTASEYVLKLLKDDILYENFMKNTLENVKKFTLANISKRWDYLINDLLTQKINPPSDCSSKIMSINDIVIQTLGLSDILFEHLKNSYELDKKKYLFLYKYQNHLPIYNIVKYKLFNLFTVFSKEIIIDTKLNQNYKIKKIFGLIISKKII